MDEHHPLLDTSDDEVIDMPSYSETRTNLLQLFLPYVNTVPDLRSHIWKDEKGEENKWDPHSQLDTEIDNICYRLSWIDSEISNRSTITTLIDYEDETDFIPEDEIKEFIVSFSLITYLLARNSTLLRRRMMELKMPDLIRVGVKSRQNNSYPMILSHDEVVDYLFMIPPQKWLIRSLAWKTLDRHEQQSILIRIFTEGTSDLLMALLSFYNVNIALNIEKILELSKNNQDMKNFVISIMHNTWIRNRKRYHLDIYYRTDPTVDIYNKLDIDYNLSDVSYIQQMVNDRLSQVGFGANCRPADPDLSELALYFCRLDRVDLLIRHNIDNLSTDNCKRCLKDASKFGSINVLIDWLNKYANIVTSSFIKEIYDVAILNDQVVVVNYLLSRYTTNPNGAYLSPDDIGTFAQNSVSVIIYCLYKGYFDIIKLLDTYGVTAPNPMINVDVDAITLNHKRIGAYFRKKYIYITFDQGNHYYVHTPVWFEPLDMNRTNYSIQQTLMRALMTALMMIDIFFAPVLLPLTLFIVILQIWYVYVCIRNSDFNVYD